MRKKIKGATKPFVVHGKFETVNGDMLLESWEGRALAMPTALRRAALALWKRKPVRWRHHSLVVLSAQGLTEAEYRFRLRHKVGVRKDGRKAGGEGRP